MLPFQPDSSVVESVLPSPNHGERAGGRMPDMILLHYTGMADANAALQRLCSPAAEVSTHYFVFEDGRIVQCVREERRAWHAGAGSWQNDADINSCSIGIEIANPGHDHGYPDFPRRQIAAVITLCRGIIARRQIPAERILGHADIAPARKKDPGEKFPWQRLHESGVGHWVQPSRIAEAGRVLSPGDSGEAISQLQGGLSKYGYSIFQNGTYDDITRDVVIAFQRHFRPSRVDGVADSSTLNTLRRLLETPPRKSN
jgi:N-acetylmuramoyl-L-alanine amidase